MVTMGDEAGSGIAKAEDEVGSENDELATGAMLDDVVAEVADEELGMSVEGSAAEELGTGSTEEGVDHDAEVDVDAKAAEVLVDNDAAAKEEAD